MMMMIDWKPPPYVSKLACTKVERPPSHCPWLLIPPLPLCPQARPAPTQTYQPPWGLQPRLTSKAASHHKDKPLPLPPALRDLPPPPPDRPHTAGAAPDGRFRAALTLHSWGNPRDSSLLHPQTGPCLTELPPVPKAPLLFLIVILLLLLIFLIHSSLQSGTGHSSRFQGTLNTTLSPLGVALCSGHTLRLTENNSSLSLDHQLNLQQWPVKI
ncbi:hypothetical protein FQN60_005106 [Etheostoma spectabile]|uniref:Uncharacterized protein n=1 Tax=Etheostoma spectabile TaxID=54343 RepID=A0A5J5DLV6_9PERO|nr:hypothetical protein FQN60_005106 [Etheostoma spectabile]